MTQPTVDELARQIERLSGDEREELLNRILLMPAERRLDAIDRGEDTPVPWEQVRGELGLK
jgi:hypothetical protein